jgi:methionyl-tRNA formyltransferase
VDFGAFDALTARFFYFVSLLLFFLSTTYEKDMNSVSSTDTKNHLLATIVVMAATILLRPSHGFQQQLGVVTRVAARAGVAPSYSLRIGADSASQLLALQYNTRSFSRLYSSSSDDNASEKARILFLGTPDVAATSLKSIYEQSQRPDSQYEVVGVVTQPPKRRKRRGKEIPSPVGLVAEELGLYTLCPEKARDADFLDELENQVRPDLCITAAYGQYLPKRFLALPKFGTLNIHPSLLPRWRGSSPVQRSLEAGDNPVGVSVLFTVSKMDAGPIVAQETLEIDENEQATTLLPKLFDIGTKTLIDALPKVIKGDITMDTATVQDESLVAEAGMIESSEGQLWPTKMSARECHNRVRGFSMWPGTFLYFQIGDDESKDPVKVKVVETRVSEATADPTDIIEIGPKKGDGLRLVCSDGSVLEMLKVQPATRNVMDAKSFVNGLQGNTVRWLSGLDIVEE